MASNSYTTAHHRSRLILLVAEFLSLRWIFWIQLIAGGAAQIIHFLLVPETRATILLDREAKRRRREGGDPHVKGPIEMHGFQLGWSE